ncbi:allatostatin-A receptor-like [Triplophysa dalaica]|uniref:allatostatin-A receptor-like n=1 Tax=Triplophysa dalaica TaxID=1582913 RepID=UPI0024E009F6|nr:allatostatin-A receptor-like [Triplophysa dalaica]
MNEGFAVFSVVDIITILLSFPINSYVIWLILTGTGNGLAAEIFNLNLAVCEILLCMEAILGLLSYVFVIFLKVVDFFDGLANTGRPLFQSLICVERYLAVVHPVYFISWLGQFFFFLSVQLFCCLAVLRALKQHFVSFCVEKTNKVEMNFSAVNIITSEASTNSTSRCINTIDINVYEINFLLGFPTHCYVLWLIVTGRGNGIASDIFNLNFSICEIGISLYCLLCVLSCWVSSLLTYLRLSLGLIYTGRPLFQCLICVERFLAVVHPVIFLKYKPLRYRLMCSAVAWLIIFCSCSFMYKLIELNFNVLRGFILMQFLVFLSIQLFCCQAVLRALKQSGPGEREREEENHMKKRAFNLILITTVSMIIVYVPYVLSVFISMLTEHNIQPLWTLTLFCFMLANFTQPALFLNRFMKFSCLCSQ